MINKQMESSAVSERFSSMIIFLYFLSLGFQTVNILKIDYIKHYYLI